MTTPVQTVGPADPNASGRVKTYTVFSALLALIPVLTVFKVITQDQGVAIGNASQALIGLAGAFGFAFVAKKTSNQVKNGTFDPPPPPEVTPAMTAVESIAAVANQFQDLTKVVADGVQHVQDVAGNLATVLLPGVKPGGLLDQVMRDGK